MLVDDQELMRTAFRVIFDQAGGVEVAGEAADGAAAIEVVQREKPDVVLMDIRMPGMDGIEATRRICASSIAKVLILTVFDLDEYVYAALRAGASGFLLKDALAADLVAAVRTVAAGEAVTAPSVTRRLIAHFVHADAIAGQRPAEATAGQRPAETIAGQRPSEATAGQTPERAALKGRMPGKSPALQPDGRLEVLTARELEVLTLIAQGRSNPEIAEQLHLSANTVSTHIGRILAKLQLRDRVQAVILGYECGLVP
ncbi:MAG TPA: response regulator transcription factor [Candidatus Limnocylindrales bacterium]